ncbi:hypothetical protein THAOC_18461 [Thalassiosira oceanica]|uniref:Uncharacterized protein n=1 Tax=Thalassiosira oceanica TaxID=159749 RepID=K0SJD6_THAOC|nr:hypothetical protein THAOC_18461 [Thalassiosira oceanica]|eukprot:EJK61101.1 hypothetical protein THAOC_18461 [Thalassiosira oceanica]
MRPAAIGEGRPPGAESRKRAAGRYHRPAGGHRRGDVHEMRQESCPRHPSDLPVVFHKRRDVLHHIHALPRFDGVRVFNEHFEGDFRVRQSAGQSARDLAFTFPRRISGLLRTSHSFNHYRSGRGIARVRSRPLTGEQRAREDEGVDLQDAGGWQRRGTAGAGHRQVEADVRRSLECGQDCSGDTRPRRVRVPAGGGSALVASAVGVEVFNVWERRYQWHVPLVVPDPYSLCPARRTSELLYATLLWDFNYLALAVH